MNMYTCTIMGVTLAQLVKAPVGQAGWLGRYTNVEYLPGAIPEATVPSLIGL